MPDLIMAEVAYVLTSAGMAAQEAAEHLLRILDLSQGWRCSTRSRSVTPSACGWRAVVQVATDGGGFLLPLPDREVVATARAVVDLPA